MLQTVMRPSIDSAAMASPANSMVLPLPPAVPMRPMMASTMSLAVMPGATWPRTVTRMLQLFFCTRVCVASACSTSLVPMPKASAPKAPWVEVCESPQTTVMPGKVAPCSGPMTWTMPWRRSDMRNSVMPNSSQLESSASTWMREIGSAMPWLRSVVGTLWSATARLAARRQGLRPLRRRPSKACGLVTSCTR